MLFRSPHPVVIFAAPVSAVGSVVALGVVITVLVAVMDAVHQLFATRYESVITFMIPAVLSPQKRVRNHLMCRQREVLSFEIMCAASCAC